MIEDTYNRFLAAAKKFPRWSNVRRRPVESTGGKLLASIVEEIAKVEDAVIEYKKDFFIVNYIGREDKIIAYLYACFVGNIEELQNFYIVKSDLIMTDDKDTFYNDISKYAYYQDGYLILGLTTENNYVTYSYNGYLHVKELSKIHIWNIFDEFAFFVGLERFEDESNKNLLTRTINIFRMRPNSTEEGLKNIICNAVSSYTNISKEDIIIEKPDEKNMALTNDDGISLYEEMARFNRDIARTKQWDVDYWDNNFRTLGYLPHTWDAPVSHYKDGVGYNNALKVDIVKNLDSEQNTDVEIKGYKKDQKKVEQYVSKNKLTKELELELKQYTDEINPIPIQYKIEASTLTEIKHPDELYIENYDTSSRTNEYNLQDLVLSADGIDIIENNRLADNTKYKLQLFPKNNKFCCSKLALRYNNQKSEKNLLAPTGNFILSGGKLINNRQIFYGDETGKFSSSTGFSDTDKGINLTDKNKGSLKFSFNSTKESVPLYINYDCENYCINGVADYITANGFTYANDVYSSSNDISTASSLIITFKGNYCSFVMPKQTAGLKTASANILVYINDVYDALKSPGIVKLNSGDYNFELQTDDYCDIRIEVRRTSSVAVVVKDIRIKRYKISVTCNSKAMELKNYRTAELESSTGAYNATVAIENFAKTDFVIDKIIVGDELTDSESIYELEIDTTGYKGSRLDIVHNGDIRLIGPEGEFSYYNIYANNSNIIHPMFLDLNSFTEIKSSTPTIRYDNQENPYINLAPGEKFSSIIISGSYRKLISRNNLKKLASLETGDKIYANKKLKSFIISKNNNAGEILFSLDKSKISGIDCDETYIYSKKDKDLTFVFVTDSRNNNEYIADRCFNSYDYIYCYDSDTIEHIAYNTFNITRDITENVDIVNNFLPAIKSTERVLYYIDDVVIDDAIVNDVMKENKNLKILVHFNTDKNWAITKEHIKITANGLINNNKLIKCNVTSLKDNFTISNNINLNETYDIGGKIVELSRCDIILPNGMEIDPVITQYTQVYNDDNTLMYIEDDGFNKLYHANIESIYSVTADGDPVGKDKYSLIGKEGIIAWKDPDLHGKQFSVTYFYKKPVGIKYDTFDFLYDVADYSIDAMENVNNKEYRLKKVFAGESFPIDLSNFSEVPDKYSVICSNPCYIGTVQNGYINIDKIADDNTLVIHNGYYYPDDGKEYWYFSDTNVKSTDRQDGVTLNNIGKSGDSLLLRTEAVNYLKNSRMECNTLGTHAIFNFKNYREIPNISSLNHIGACRSFSAWNSFKMNISLSDEYDGDCIVFNSQDSDGYAILDVTEAVAEGKTVSCYNVGKLKISLGRDILISSERLVKSLYVERIEEFKTKGQLQYCNLHDIDKEKYRYYIIVENSGTLVETIVSDNDKDISDCHEKAFTKFGLKINEKMPADTEAKLDFTLLGAIHNGTESTRDQTLQTGTSADWGITKIKDFSLLNDIAQTKFRLRNDYLTSISSKARVETKPVKLEFKKSTEEVIFKINDYCTGKLKGFNITAYGSNTENGTYSEIASSYNTNILSVPASRLTNYIKFVLEADAGKDITHLEAFVMYNENSVSPVRITDNISGYCITKIFDVGCTGKFYIEDIDADETNPENIRYEARGLRVNDDNVYTDWYDIDSEYVFDNYRYVQLKVTLDSAEASTKINNITLKYVE